MRKESCSGILPRSRTAATDYRRRDRKSHQRYFAASANDIAPGRRNVTSYSPAPQKNCLPPGGRPRGGSSDSVTCGWLPEDRLLLDPEGFHSGVGNAVAGPVPQFLEVRE